MDEVTGSIPVARTFPMKSVDAVFAATLVALGAFSLLVLHRIIRDWPPRARKFAPLLFVLPALILTGAFQGYLSLKSIAYPVESIWIVRTPEPGFLIETKRQAGSRRVPVRETEFMLLNDQGQLIERYVHISESEVMKRHSAVRIDGACRPDQDSVQRWPGFPRFIHRVWDARAQTPSSQPRALRRLHRCSTGSCAAPMYELF
jgi:hypothetical protein